MKIKKMPEDERPIEKALSQGIKSLSNSELLGIIIKTGIKNSSSIDLARELISKLDEGIYSLGNIALEELTKVKGIGNVKAVSIMAAMELGNRVRASKGIRYKIGGAKDVVSFVMDQLQYERKEHFFTLILNTKGEIIQKDLVAIGGLSSAEIHPREVFANALRRSGASVIFIHNHPSGDPSPSREDINITRRLISAGEILGIDVLDHIIIGKECYKSFLEEGLMEPLNQTFL